MLYSGQAASIVIITLGLSHKPLCDWITNFISPQPWWVPSSCGLILLLPWAFKKPGLVSRFLRLRYIHRYPPIWVSAWIAILFVLVAFHLLSSRPHWQTIREDMAIPTFETFFLLSLFVLIIRNFSALYAWACAQIPMIEMEPDTLEKKQRSATELNLDNSDDFIEWLKTDKPITSFDQDCLNHQIIARRMAKRLALDPPPSQAVIGAFGTGKTTLGELVKEALAQQGDSRRIRLIQIEVWPCASVEAALEAILRKVLDELEKEVALPHLHQLPEHYVEAIKATNHWGACLMYLLYGSQTDAKALLNQLNEIAGILNLRIVLWIEDLERFIGMNHHQVNESNNQLDQKIGKQLAPLHALVDLLGKKPPKDQPHTIVPIFATTLQETSFGLKRIADYVETLNVVDYEKTAKLFFNLETLMIDPNRWGKKVIDPASPSVRDEGKRCANWVLELQALTNLLKIHGFPIRDIKASLRRSYEYWEHYPGEVDPHDLLLLKMIKEQAGAARLLDELATLEGLATEPQFANDPDQPIRIEHFNNLKKALTYKWHLKPQGIGFYKIYYWQRIMAEPEISEIESDQVQYREVIAAAKANNRTALSDYFSEDPPEKLNPVVACLFHLDDSEKLFERVMELWKEAFNPMSLVQILNASKIAIRFKEEAPQKWDEEKALDCFLTCIEAINPENCKDIDEFKVFFTKPITSAVLQKRANNLSEKFPFLKEIPSQTALDQDF